jgi:hypothetical protein
MDFPARASARQSSLNLELSLDSRAGRFLTYTQGSASLRPETLPLHESMISAGYARNHPKV